MPKLYTGSRGGTYYKKGGKKVYVKQSNFGYLNNFGNELSPIISTILTCIIDRERSKTIQSYIENNGLKLNKKLYKQLETNVGNLDTEKQKDKLKKLIKWGKLAIRAAESGSTARRASKRGWGVQPSESIKQKGANMTLGGVEDIKTLWKTNEEKAIEMVKKLIPNVNTMFKKDIRTMNLIDIMIVDAILQLRDDIPQSPERAADKFKSYLCSEKLDKPHINAIYEKLYPSEQEGSNYIEVPRDKEHITRYRNLKDSFMELVPEPLKSKYRGFFMMTGIGGIDDGAILQWFARNSIFGKSEDELEATIAEYGVTEKVLTRRGTERFKALSPEERHQEMMESFEHFTDEEIDQIFEKIKNKRRMPRIAEFGYYY